MRDLMPDERRTILLLARRFGSDEKRNQLLADLERCTVEEKVPDGSILGFDIAGYERPLERGRWQYRQKDGFVVDGTVKDVDGSDMHVMLLADSNHRVWEFEIVRHGIGAVIRPNWHSFRMK